MPFPWMGTSFVSMSLIVISIILMGVSSARPHVFDGVRSHVSDFFSPVIGVVSLPFQNITAMAQNAANFAQLQAKNQKLEQENDRLREWYQTALLLNSENKSLRDLLNLNIREEHKHIGARVIADAGNTYVKSLIALAGEDKGVNKGDAVLSGEGLIGRIVHVGEETSRILLVDDINSRVPVVVEDTGQHAVMAGANDLNPRLIHLPQDSKIAEGARIITSGYGGVYLSGLPVGRVVLNDKGMMDVVLFSDFNRLQIVRIVQKLNNTNK